MASKIPELPSTQSIPSGAMSWIKNWLDTARLWVQTRDPSATLVGDPLDKFPDRRELVSVGLLTRKTDGSFSLGVGSIPGPKGDTGPIGPAGAGVTPPDYSAPPTPTGLVVTAGLHYLYIEWDAPTYTLGHGNAQTLIYGAIWAPGDTEPTFGDVRTKLIDTIAGAANIDAFPAPLGTRYCIWIAFETVDGISGVASSAIAGGTYGVQATTGVIGNTDLGPLIVSADKLSQGTYSGVNMVPNPGAEDGVVAWMVDEVTGAGGTLTVDTTTKWGGSQAFKIAKVATTDGANAISLAMPVIPGETYGVRVRVLGGAAAAGGLYLRLNEAAPKPSGNYVTTALRTSFTDLVSGGAIAAAWTQYESTYLVPAGVFWVSLAVYDWVNGPTALWFDDLAMGRQITAVSMAANSIAVGTLAVQNGALVNAMIGNLAVDDAKIASVAVAKLTAGSLAVGAYAQSTGFVAGSSGWQIKGDGTAEFAATMIRGQLVASQIDSRGLSIKDGSGAVILAAGSPLDFANVGGSTKPANNATVGATAGSNLKDSLGNVLTDGSVKNNLMDASWWATANAPGGGWALNEAADGTADVFAVGQGPDGNDDIFWKATAGTAGGATGGWNPGNVSGGAGNWFNIDTSKTYRFIVPIYRGAGASGTTYWGIDPGDVCDLNTTTANGNPYFAFGAPTTGKWFLYVGYVFPYGSAGHGHSGAGIYDMATGALVATGTNYNWSTNSATGTRAYQYYASSGSTVFFGKPMVHLVDGSEPSLSGILSSGAASGRNPITAANASTFIAAAAIDIAQIKTASITDLSALSAYMGTVEIASGGHLLSGQTAYNIGTGFWLGSVSGVPKFSIGSAGGASLTWDGTSLTINQPSLALSSFTASNSGNVSYSTLSTGGFSIGTATATVSGGAAPYSYQWALINSYSDAGSGHRIIAGSTVNGSLSAAGTTPYVSFSGTINTGEGLHAKAVCTFTDANGLTSSTGLNVTLQNTA